MTEPTTLVVPCFNEAARLDGDALCAWLNATEWASLLLVDDGSHDDTRAVLEAIAARSPRAQVLALPTNQGKGEAVRQGLLTALAGEAEVVGFWDADLATPLDEVPRLLEALRAVPSRRSAIGSRVLMLGARIQRSTSRHYVGRIAATMAAWVLDLAVYDTQCGAKLFTADDGLRDALRRPFHTRWVFDVELLLRLRKQHANVPAADFGDIVVEVPLRRWVDVADSRITLADVFRAPIDLLRIAWRER